MVEGTELRSAYFELIADTGVEPLFKVLSDRLASCEMFALKSLCWCHIYYIYRHRYSTYVLYKGFGQYSKCRLEKGICCDTKVPRVVRLLDPKVCFCKLSERRVGKSCFFGLPQVSSGDIMF